MKEQAPRIDADRAFNPELRQGDAEWDAYLDSRPYEDAKGNIHHPTSRKMINADAFFDNQYADLRTGREKAAADASYENLTPSQLAVELAKAEHAGDTTLQSHIDAVINGKVYDAVEHAKDHDAGGNHDREQYKRELMSLKDRKLAQLDESSPRVGQTEPEQPDDGEQGDQGESDFGGPDEPEQPEGPARPDHPNRPEGPGEPDGGGHDAPLPHDRSEAETEDLGQPVPSQGDQGEPHEDERPRAQEEHEPTDQEIAQRVLEFSNRLKDKTYVPTPEEFAEMRELRDRVQPSYEPYPGENPGDHDRPGALSYYVGYERMNSSVARSFLDNTRLSRWAFLQAADIEYAESVLDAGIGDVPDLNHQQSDRRRNYLTYREFKKIDDTNNEAVGLDRDTFPRYQIYMRSLLDLDAAIVDDEAYSSDPEHISIRHYVDPRGVTTDGAIRSYRRSIEEERLERQARRADRRAARREWRHEQRSRARHSARRLGQLATRRWQPERRQERRERRQERTTRLQASARRLGRIAAQRRQRSRSEARTPAAERIARARRLAAGRLGRLSMRGSGVRQSQIRERVSTRARKIRQSARKAGQRARQATRRKRS